MNIYKEVAGGLCTIYLEGEFDGEGAAKHEKELMAIFELEHDSFNIDMGKLTYLSSAGIRIMVTMLKRAHALKKTLKLKALQPSVRNVLDLTGLLKIFES